MTDPLKLMDEIRQLTPEQLLSGRGSELGYQLHLAIKTKNRWFLEQTTRMKAEIEALKNVIEAQAEELAQQKHLTAEWADKAMQFSRDKAKQAEELALAKQWINDLQSGMYINCVYCGHRYGPESEVPASMADVLKEHIEQCPEHPMSRLKEELTQARARIARLEDGISEALMGIDYHELSRVFNESPRKSLAAVKAEALREFAKNQRKEANEEQHDGILIDRCRYASTAATMEADRLEREAKEES